MKNLLITTTSALLMGMGLSSCQVEPTTENEAEDQQDDTRSFQELTFDASDYSTWVYVNLTTGLAVNENEDWDIALQRYDAMAHADVSMALIAEQSEFYDNGSALVEQFVNTTAENELEHLENAQLPEDSEFETAETNYAISADVFSQYSGAPAHTFVAVDTKFFLISSNDGNAFAKLRAVQIADPSKTYADADVYDTAIFEFEVAADSASAFSTAVEWRVSTPNGIGHACFDIETSATVDCTDSTWDVKYSNTGSGFGANPIIQLNSGLSGSGSAKLAGTFDTTETANIATPYQDAADDAYDLVAQSYSFGSTDAQSSVFSDYPAFSYGVNGGHAMWPNYRVYAVRNATNTHFIQFTNYYNDLAESGHVTLRLITSE